MEKFKEIVREANKAFNVADHTTYVTYNLVKDPKLILVILENLYLSLYKAMEAVLYYDRLYKRIFPLPEGFGLRFNIFRNKCAVRYNITKEEADLMLELKELVEQHKRSPMEFIRKDKLVICTRNYRTQTINIEKIKQYVIQAKPFILKVNNILQKNDIR